MRHRQAGILVRIVVAAMAWLVAGLCASSAEAKPNPFAFYNASDAEMRGAPGALIRFESLALPSVYRAKAFRILYATRDYAGRPIASSAVVLVSDYAKADKRIIAWAHPTTGVARKCAPSLRSSPLESIEGVKDMIGAGYIVAATDYPGLGTPGPMGYLVGLGQARAVIDSVRATRQLLSLKGTVRYAVWGYSQGAHAALFAANIAASYAPELQLVGVAAAAPPTSLPALFDASSGSLEGRIISALTIQSWSRKYGASYNALVDPASRGVVGNVAANCVDDLGSKLDILAAQKPLEQRFFVRNPVQTPPWAGFMQQNSITGLRAGVPLFIAQGTADGLVKLPVTVGFLRATCRTGDAVKYLPLDNVGHGLVGRKSARAALAWIGDRFAGRPAPSSCR